MRSGGSSPEEPPLRVQKGTSYFRVKMLIPRSASDVTIRHGNPRADVNT